jgi:hypothetical protein
MQGNGETVSEPTRLEDLRLLTEDYRNEPYWLERDRELSIAASKGRLAPWARDIDRHVSATIPTVDDLVEALRAEGFIVIGRDENGKWQFDAAVLDGYPDLYEMAPQKVEALSTLGVKMWPTNNGFIITSVLDALASVQEATK